MTWLAWLLLLLFGAMACLCVYLIRLNRTMKQFLRVFQCECGETVPWVPVQEEASGYLHTSIRCRPAHEEVL